MDNEVKQYTSAALHETMFIVDIGEIRKELSTKLVNGVQGCKSISYTPGSTLVQVVFADKQLGKPIPVDIPLTNFKHLRA